MDALWSEHTSYDNWTEKVVHFDPFLSTTSGGLRDSEYARCFQKQWQRWQGRRPGIRQVGQKEPRTHLHLIWVVSPNLPELSEQKQTTEPFFETANHATSNLNYQYEKWQRVLPVPSCELKREV